MMFYVFLVSIIILFLSIFALVGIVLRTKKSSSARPALKDLKKWITIYIVFYLALSIPACMLYAFFVPAGGVGGPINLCLPFPTRRCSFIPPKISKIKCEFDPTYVVASIIFFASFLVLFLIILIKKEIKTKLKIVIALLCALLAYSISFWIYLKIEMLRSAIIWEREVAPLYEEEKNKYFAREQIEKAQSNIGFSIFYPDETPCGLLFKSIETRKLSEPGGKKDFVKIYLAKDLFGVTVIQTTSQTYSIEYVKQQAETRQKEYDAFLSACRQREESIDEGSDCRKAAQSILEFKPYIELIDPSNGIYYVSRKEGKDEWRPYIYTKKKSVYLVIRGESDLSKKAQGSEEIRNKLVEIGQSFLNAE